MKLFKIFLTDIYPRSLTSGTIIRALRKSLDLTLKEVELISGIEEAELLALENDSYELTKLYAEKLGATFGVHPILILFPEGPIQSDEIKEIENRRNNFIALQ